LGWSFYERSKDLLMTLTEELADVLVRRTVEDLGSEPRQEAKRLLLDFLGVAIAGSQMSTGRISSRFAVELGGPAEATLAGGGTRVAAVHAAFANAIAAHSIELDDVDEDAYFHYGPPVLSAALAAAEKVHASGPRLLLGVVAGCETMTRLSRALNPSLRNRGFHTTPTCGVFGATAAAGVLLGLSDSELVSAFGLAGAQASGLMEMYGPSMQKRFNPGPAARNGVTAAIMGQAGFTGADTILEGDRGFAVAFAGPFDAELFRKDLGTEIPIPIEYKPYSCARPIHNAIDAMLELRERGACTADLKDITLYRHPLWADYHLIPEPRSFHEAQMSLPYSAALALTVGQALPEHYARVGQGDDEVMALSRRIHVRADASLARGVSVRAVAHSRDGQEITATVDYPSGSRQRPLTWAQLEAKFHTLCTGILGEHAAQSLAEAARRVDSLDDVSQLTRWLAPRASR
jgi:2-methylcitrate dehydratase PrpD